MSRLRKFLDLPADERRLLLSALGGLPLVTAGVFLLGYKRMRTLLAGAQIQAQPATTAQGAEAERVARAVRLAATRGPTQGTCLSRALLLWRMLNRRGIPAEVRFGVRAGDSDMEAHAWVEQGGRSLDDGFEEHEFANLKPARPEDPAAP